MGGTSWDCATFREALTVAVSTALSPVSPAAVGILSLVFLCA